jgi:hypothetical protein
LKLFELFGNKIFYYLGFCLLITYFQSNKFRVIEHFLEKVVNKNRNNE